MSKMRFIGYVSLLALLSYGAWGQSEIAIEDQAPPELTLMRDEILPVQSIPLAPMQGPFRCDQDGNIFVRSYDAQAPFQTPLKRIAINGEVKATYSILSADPQYQGGAYFVNAKGEVYQLSWTTKAREIHVVRYSSGGEVKSNIKLDTFFHPDGQIVVFSDGAILVAGLDGGTPEKASTAPFTAIFKDDGTLLKKLTLPSDREINDAVERGDDLYGDSSSGSNLAVAYGTAIADEAGTVYLMRRESTARIFSINSAGEVSERFKVSSDDSTLLASNMFISQGKLIVVFRNESLKKTKVKIVDLSSGEALAEYGVNPNLGSALTCYREGKFYFLGEKAKQLAFYSAVPR